MAAPRDDLRFVLKDEYGEMFVDPQGYAWRGPEFEPRYAVLHSIDHLQAGGWTKIGDWFKSRNPLDEYKPSTVEQLWDKVIDPGEKAKGAASSIATYILLGGVLYVAAQTIPVLIQKRG